MKQVQLEDHIYSVPDDATLEEIDGFIRAQELPARQAASKAAFEANLPKSDMRRVYEAAKETMFPTMPISPSGPAANMLGIIAPGGPSTEGMGLAQGFMHSPAMETASSLVNALKSRIPDSLRATVQPSYAKGIQSEAGGIWDQLHQALNSERIVPSSNENVVSAAQTAERLAGTTKSTVPPPLRGYMETEGQRLIDALKGTAPQDFTFEQGRDLAKRAGQLSQFETSRTDPQMFRSLNQFARGMDEVNRVPAEAAGMGNMYDQAMAGTARGKALEELGIRNRAALKKAAIAAALLEGTRRVLRTGVGSYLNGLGQ